MSLRFVMTALGTAAMLCPAVSSAQPGPPNRERELAQVIRQAGYDCGRVESIEVPTNPPLDFESFTPEIVVCVGGKKFLIARTGRGGNTEKPLVRPLF
jgi:hypothetical protein